VPRRHSGRRPAVKLRVFLHIRLSLDESCQSALRERHVHFGLLFLARVLNSPLRNFPASEAVNGP
jgi:hypothetical protein